VGRVTLGFYRAYFERRSFRRLLDGANITQRLLQGGPAYNPLFRVPPADERAALLEALGDPPVPRVQAERPVLIEWWRRDGVDQLHLVNYADAPQEVEIALPWPARGRVLSPDGPDNEKTPTLEGRSLRMTLDIYAVLEMGGSEPRSTPLR
jgi:hypothetical protein